MDNQHFFAQCPHCRTIFRVAAVASEASEGWVKCGRCKKVFDSDKNKVEPTQFVKAEEKSDVLENKTDSRNQILDPKAKPTALSPPDEKSGAIEDEADSRNQTLEPKVKPTAFSASDEKSDILQQVEGNEIITEPSNPSSLVEPKQHPSSELESGKIQEEKPEDQLSFIQSKAGKKIESKMPQAPLFNEETKSDQSAQKIEALVHTKEKTARNTERTTEKNPVEIRADHRQTSSQSTRIIQSLESEKSASTTNPPKPSLTPIRKVSAEELNSFNIKAEKKKKSEKTQWTKSILAQAQSWKKEKNRFKSRRSYTSLLFALCLLALLIWQVAIVNYSKLANYSFLSAPLNLTCAVFSCNQNQPANEHEFEILHASLRRHASIPGVITVSANLINYSNTDKFLPTIRLDLTDANESIVASRSINLVDNPQYVDPTISQLAPGQDVKLVFDIDRPIHTAVGFELNIIN